jgi:hydrogenase maturation factor
MHVCIGAPAVVLSVEYSRMTAIVDYGDGVPREVLIGISQDRVKPGSIVIVHAGVIVSEMSIEEVLEQIEFIKSILEGEESSVVRVYEQLLEASKRIRGG